MTHSAKNPYLPLWEYIPDGEPRVFGDRLYIYGSHDFAGGEKGFCPGDYVVWSAPLSDLGDWRCDGVILRRSDVPDFSEVDALAAPDVVQGPDGRYYLYFNPLKQRTCRVGVSERPEGSFTLIGEVCLPDGTPYDEYKMFDPGVLVEGEKVYLFTGFCMKGPLPERMRGRKSPSWSMGFELEPDMKTIRRGPVDILPGGNVTAGTDFENHGFYEASSPRKINGKYVMVYSTEQSHELGYALADEPLGPYHYEGVLVSGANIGWKGNTRPEMPYGNVHGGLEELNGSWYIFYHRQTSGQEASRQGCAEKLPLRADGWFGQAQTTSGGLGGVMPAKGRLSSWYCCHLTAPDISPKKYDTKTCRRAQEPHLYEESTGPDERQSLHYIANIGPETVVGFRFFDFSAPKAITLRLRGTGTVSVTASVEGPEDTNDVKGNVLENASAGEGGTLGEASKALTCGKRVVGTATASLTGNWQDVVLPISPICGTHGLYLTFDPINRLDFESLGFE